MSDRPRDVSSHRADEFTPEGLLAAKGEALVSVVIPARDEASTVGAVVRRVHDAWVEGVPLVDEIVVVDSDSTDGTADAARAAGARVVAAAEVLPELGATPGKGEALWKSLHVTGGDLLVFLDADLIDWGTHFVSGLLGPLLTRPEISLVKAVYHRPLLDEAGNEAETGGRVTELVARPLLALHRPELTGVVQPLSGEWAVRRSHLEDLPMPVGYGVEIAALVDTADRLGPGAIAQVDLGLRTHRHHRHDTLGPMAVQVVAAVEARRDLPDPLPIDTEVALVQYERDASGFVPRPQAVRIGERPPAVSIVGYRAGIEERRAALAIATAGASAGATPRPHPQGGGR